MKRTFIAAAVAALSLSASLAQATVIESAYSALGGGSWLVDFRVVQEAGSASFAGFTIDIADATDLAVVATPGGWDSMVFQPAAGLQDPGAFDSFMLAGIPPLSAGQSVSGFRFSFMLAGGATPGALPYLLSDADFNPVAAGITTVTAVPEPATMLMAAFGLGMLGLRAARQRRQDRWQAETIA
ncbi:PEP-CTERM sorting domain-containing protein [Aquincola tertiaricarbonis]|uniref:PEP-CTERM sorting domain-containing protein n=1 Tax=Aquincola tertiaricarbonis TaxID=391953 RepID=A0ABY4S2N5_AQUTE|nr:PEP-CTERM sorting domain-containing protein [Aquincola tertiaricarbonis]URI06450.1 PEP-CTERM sorting domain-containing protein [Aquincola tertiaricarbonis]